MPTFPDVEGQLTGQRSGRTRFGPDQATGDGVQHGGAECGPAGDVERERSVGPLEDEAT